MKMSNQCPRFQIAFLGAGSVGKTSILQQYLFGSVSTRYNETVEDTFSQPYFINHKLQNIDYIDTAGSISFPAMRDVYMTNASGFVLVYSIQSEDSFKEMVALWEKIKAVRKNILNIPVVIVGNQTDLENKRQIETFDAMNWAYHENLGGCFVETSALDNKNVREVFDLLLGQLGNTRARQNGPFRLRSTSLSRRPDESEESRRNAKDKIRAHFKSKSFSIERVSPSDKDFQECVFDNYKQSNITRVKREVHRQQTIYTDAQNNNVTDEDNINNNKANKRTVSNEKSCSRNNYLQPLEKNVNSVKRTNSKDSSSKAMIRLSTLTLVLCMVRKFCQKRQPFSRNKNKTVKHVRSVKNLNK